MIILKLIMPNLYYFQKQAVIFRMDILLIRKFFESKAIEIDLIPVAPFPWERACPGKREIRER